MYPTRNVLTIGTQVIERIKSLTFLPIMIIGALVLPLISSGHRQRTR
jgi:hypothetical protein